MMKIVETAPGYTGRIQPFLLNKLTQERTLLTGNHNVVAYTAADLMARIMAGDASYLPRHIGFIYGTEYSPLLSDPDSLPVDTRRVHDWSRIASDVAAINGNILICPLTNAPSIGLDGSPTYYTNNAITFSSHTGLGLEYGFPTTGSTYAQSLDVLQDDYLQAVYFYQVVLLNRWEGSGGRITYTPFSRAALGTAPFDPKPADHELGVFWTLTYK